MAKSKGGVTVSKVWELCEPIVTSLGLSLWDVRYVKEGAQWYLRIFIDKPDGVSIDDCEKVSRAINDPLDALDPIENAYCLEVCSPVRLRRPIEGIGRDLDGKLKAYEDGMVTIVDHAGENELTISKKDAAWIKLDDFDI